MAHMLILYGQRETTNIMIEDFFKSICYGNNLEVKAVRVDEVTGKVLMWSDMVMGIRTQNILEADLMALAKRNGRLVIEMIDDDFLAIKDYHTRRYLQEKAFLRALKYADIILGSNKELLEKMLLHMKEGRSCMLHTAVADDEIYKRTITDKDELKIAYYASDGATNNFDHIIKPILKELEIVINKKIQWYFFTTNPDMSNTPYADSVIYYESMPLDDFRKTLNNLEIDIGIAPLLDSEYNSGKYVNKFFEFGRASIPAIYSNVKPYVGFVKDEVDGILADNTKEAWLKAFEKMSDVKMRELISENSQVELKTTYSIKAIEKKIFEDIPELLYEHNGWNRRMNLRFYKFKSRLYKAMDKPARAMGRVRVEGIGSTYRWILNHYIKREQ